MLGLKLIHVSKRGFSHKLHPKSHENDSCCAVVLCWWILTHWGRVTYICVGKLTIIGSNDGLSPGRCQAIIWTNAGILLFGPLGSYFCEIVIEIDTFSFKKMHLNLSSAKWRPSCLSLNELNMHQCYFTGNDMIGSYGIIWLPLSASQG